MTMAVLVAAALFESVGTSEAQVAGTAPRVKTTKPRRSGGQPTRRRATRARSSLFEGLNTPGSLDKFSTRADEIEPVDVSKLAGTRVDVRAAVAAVIGLPCRLRNTGSIRETVERVIAAAEEEQRLAEAARALLIHPRWD
jgi:hypothetical protein